MYLYHYLFMCLYIGVYQYFNWTDTPFPESLRPVNVWVNWAFLLWTGYTSGKIIVDCMLSGFRKQMTPANVRNGILLALLHFLPVLLMALFMLNEGFAEP